MTWPLLVLAGQALDAAGYLLVMSRVHVGAEANPLPALLGDGSFVACKLMAGMLLAVIVWWTRAWADGRRPLVAIVALIGVFGCATELLAVRP